MTTRLQLDLSFAGKTPIVTGNKLQTVQNLERLIRAIKKGSQYRNASTGSGSVVLATSPTLVTPTLGVASASTINKVPATTRPTISNS
jgi:hypothetical protein